MFNTQIIECDLKFNLNGKEDTCTCSLPRGAKILKNNYHLDPFKIFALYEGIPNGRREDFTFFLVKQDKNTIPISKNIKLEAKEHLRTFVHNNTTFHLFKLNQ